MSTYIPSFNNGRLKEPLQNSCSLESAVPPGNAMMYMNFSSENSQQPNISIDIPSAGIHDSNVVSQQQLCESRSRGNEFSLLRDCRSNEMLLMGSHIPPSGIRFHSDQYQNPNTGFSCFGEESTQDSESYPYGIGNVVSGSKHLKAAQELLDEVVNVKTALKQRHCKQDSRNDSKEVNWESKDQQDSSPLSAAEKQDLQNKMTKLSSMLNEVDRRYKQYHHQMQMVVSSFDVIAGCGAAKSYTALALQTISSHFRCLRDGINSQIKVTKRRLGDKDSNGQGIAISRLRFVDQQLRQQRHVQQFGMIHQHIWRPQRGLPESSVSILRAWLFEHFLHPYPKDSEKMMLARQTGLTRSQVSNWFINARVRLWKPMVEEMYKEESVDAAMDSNSSSDVAPKKTSLDRAEDTNQSAASSYQGCRITGPIVDDCNVYKNTIIQSNNEGVSLTLRLQHSENSSLPHMSLGSHHYSLLDLRGGNGGGEVHDVGGGGSSVAADAVDFSRFR